MTEAIHWRNGSTGAWHQQADLGDLSLGAGERTAEPRQYFWIVYLGMAELGSGRAPTLGAAKGAAEHFSRRYTGSQIIADARKEMGG